MKHKWRLVLGGLIFLLLLIHWAGNLRLGGNPPGSYDGWTANNPAKGGVSVIIRVNENGPAKALQVGDEVVSINGVAVAGNVQLLNFNRTVPPGTRYVMIVRRAGQLREIPLQTVPYAERGSSVGRAWMALVYLLFLLTGAFIFVSRGNDRQAWLLALMLWTLTGLSGANVIVGLPAWLSAPMTLARIVAIWFLPLFLHFFLIFPEPSPLLRRFPRLERLLYVPFCFTALIAFGLSRLPASLLGSTLSAFFNNPWVGNLGRLFLLAYIFAGLLSLVVNYRVADQMARRRLRVILVGSGLGFLNLFLMPLGDYLGLTARFPQLWAVFDTALSFTLPLVPLSFAYALIRHQVIPVGLIIRRGVRYLLVSRGSLLLVGLGAGLLVNLLLRVLTATRQLPVGRLGLIAALIGIAVWTLARRLHERVVAPAIDRRFFRSAYDAQQIIAELTESLRTTTGLPQLAELLATRVQSALQAENVTVFVRDPETGDYRSFYSCAYSPADGKVVACGCESRLPHYAATVAHLAAVGEPLELEAGEIGPQLNGGGEPTDIEREVLRDLKTALLVPLKAKAEPAGLISLGARLGDLPFSAEDKRLLLSVGAPTSLAIENARLVERLIEDARRREELEAENEARARELEEARQLQLSMLPKHIPQLPHLEIAAYMKTATEVGGDYYDFHLAADGTLTIAVGDATGHGLKAGTVVTAMKSLFRTLAAEPDLAAILRRSSQVLKEMNLRALFMALTLVKLSGGTLRLASAGMPAALLYRAQTGTVEEVLMKTMPLGSVRNYPYREVQFDLQAGDIVLLLSDGFPERFNAAGEMLGYERGGELLAHCADHTAPQIIERFVAVGDEWATGRPPDDDVTFVVLKLKSLNE